MNKENSPKTKRALLAFGIILSALALLMPAMFSDVLFGGATVSGAPDGCVRINVTQTKGTANS